MNRGLLNTIFPLWVLVFCGVFGNACTAAESPAQKCPVVIDRIDLTYSHQGGQSKPELKVSFGNAGGRRVATVLFSLSLLNSSGDLQTYPEDLAYRDGLDPDKKRVFIWELAPESVDIHRAGEIVVIKKVGFDDAGSVWTDDGSETCKLTVDYHAR